MNKALKYLIFALIAIMCSPCYASEIAENKVVALTFDDGPHAKYTPMILDILKKYNARATFFVIGERAEKLPEVVQRVSKENHSVGNHTYNHTELTRLNDTGILAEISKTNEVIKKLTGVRPVLLRPPLGLHSKHVDSLVNDQSMSTVLWNIDPLDWYHKNAQRTHDHVVSRVKSGDIILMHDFYSNTVEATEKILQTLQADGYRFVTIDELLGIRGGYSGRDR